MSDACEFSSLEEANEIFGLIMRRWNTIAGTLSKAKSTCRSCWRTKTAWLTATTGQKASCTACTCATMAGLS